MSIIEKAADMLGSTLQPQRKSSAAGEEANTTEPGLIERAVSNDSRRSDFPKDNHLAAAGHSEARPASAAGRVSPTLNVDLDKLRRQNMITPDSQRTLVAENFRRIKRPILAKVVDPNAGPGTNLVMITSSLPGEGKTFCAINLAISIAMEMDHTVLLVDADVARPSVTSALGIKVESERGLMDVLLDRGVDLADVLCKTNIGKLSVLLSGTPHTRATEVLASETMRVLLQQMAERYRDRIIIFDSPPLLVTSEACVLASHMGQILVVVEAEKTTETALKDALSRIEPRNVMGVLLNKGAAPGPGHYGYDGYGYDGYGYVA